MRRREITQMSNFPVPTKIFLQNFGSHKNTIITFGEIMDRCYITGSSGSGKSHVLNALQYVLGRKIERDNEFFTFEEIDDVLNKLTQELGEFNDAVQKYRGRYCRSRVDLERVKEEAGDFLFNLISLLFSCI